MTWLWGADGIGCPSDRVGLCCSVSMKNCTVSHGTSLVAAAVAGAAVAVHGSYMGAELLDLQCNNIISSQWGSLCSKMLSGGSKGIKILSLVIETKVLL